MIFCIAVVSSTEKTKTQWGIESSMGRGGLTVLNEMGPHGERYLTETWWSGGLQACSFLGKEISRCSFIIKCILKCSAKSQTLTDPQFKDLSIWGHSILWGHWDRGWPHPGQGESFSKQNRAFLREESGSFQMQRGTKEQLYILKQNHKHIKQPK